jgi:hypothetical protein
MTTIHSNTMSIAFIEAEHLLIQSKLSEVVLVVKHTYDDNPNAQILVFDATTSHVIDLDLRGSDADILARMATLESPAIVAELNNATDVITNEDPVRGRGRPKLGVVPREVTLLPRHWEWLNRQTGGASVALRKLVEEARRNSESKQQARLAMDSAYRFMAGIAGNQPRFEEASRALFAGDGELFSKHTNGWPKDVVNHLMQLAQAAFDSVKGN